MIIKYQNSSESFITEQQAIILGEYNKLYFQSGSLIKEEEFDDNEIYGLIIYNHNNQSHQTLINTNFDKTKYEVFTIIEEQNFPEGLYLKKLYLFDSNEILLGKTHSLYDTNNKLIGYERFLDNNTFPDERSKQYWDISINPNNIIFECIFDKNTGNIDSLYFNQEHLNNSGQDHFTLDIPNDIQELINITGMSQQLAGYYSTPEIIPNF